NNRRYLFDLAKIKMAIASRYKQPLSAMMFDIDHFKKINDLHGHIVGDQILIEIVNVVQAEMRKSDVIGRYGGEEFIILLPMTTAQQAHKLAERIRINVEGLRVPSERGDVSATISIGIVEIDHQQPVFINVEELFSRADEAMYTAKRRGRNRVVILRHK
ncbi:MAG: GGDEF domain-containing protein, partial [Anaerolineales bacterium]|nr:GGDEF domain-containing protein [Anaerolineales bacterium]